MNSEKLADSKEDTGVVVTTAHRGIFFGYLKEKLDGGRTVVLTDSRNAIYYDSATLGFIGLAAQGPGPGCRIGPSAPEHILYDVTSIVTCTPEATAAWETGPWSK